MRGRVWLAAIVFLYSCSSPEKSRQVVTPAPAPAEQQAARGTEQVLVTDSNGMTIYYHDRDEPKKSRCNDSCSQYWLPVRPNSQLYSSPSFGVITRKDGSQQVTFESRPLYTFFNDKKPGDTKGDGKQGIWHALRY